MARKNTHTSNKNTRKNDISQYGRLTREEQLELAKHEEISEYDYINFDHISEYDYMSPEEFAELDIDDIDDF